MKKLWNIPDMPVWSISTCDSAGIPNMNICTYMTPVSMNPKKYIIAVYPNTQTYTNVQNSEFLLAQLLSEEQAHLVRLLGKKSSLYFPKKMQSITKTTETDGIFSFLPKSIGYFILKKDTSLLQAGDHDVAIFSIEKIVYLNPLNKVLTLSYLKERGLIA
jgi:flavin reductase (DIM6/NTAB) family NADH-FMN oxidoreductase RutF